LSGRDELTSALNGPVRFVKKEEMLEYIVDESTFGAGVRGGLGKSLDGAMLVAPRAGLKVREA
jgi:hypothetical protein